MAQGGRRFLIDASMIQGGGGFTFAVNAVPALARIAPEDRFRVFVRNQTLADSLRGHEGLDVELLPPPSAKERLRFTYLEGPRIAKQWGADLYFSSGDYAPLKAPCPVIGSFQNPNVFSKLDQRWPLRQKLRLATLRTLARLTARTCDRVHFVSEDSARWMGDLAGVAPSKRLPVLHGIDAASWKAGAGDASGSEEAPAHGRPYILSVSSIYRYKNFVKLIEAYAELARRRADVPDLVIIGDNQDAEYADQMEHARVSTGDLASRIHILGEVPYAEIQRYYRAASMFVFPSYLETFGFPLIEAMASGLPLIASDIPVFREVAQDAAFFADPHDAGSLASAMETALFAPGARELLVKRGRERLRYFTWERAARQLLDAFDAVLAERAAPSRRPAPVLPLDATIRSGAFHAPGVALRGVAFRHRASR